jgi:hypothetical protein
MEGYLFMKRKIYLIILSLTLIVATVACSGKPPKEEFDKLALDEFHKNVCSKNYCQSDNDRLCSYVHYNNGNPCTVFATLFYFLGTEIVKNEDKENVGKYPFAGKSYYLLVIVHTTKCSDFNKESYKKAFEDKVSKLKVEDFKNTDSINIEGPDMPAMTDSKIYSEQFKWDKAAKSWQQQINE